MWRSSVTFITRSQIPPTYDSDPMNFQPPARRHSSGFTLVEMLITVTVAAILMAIAAPSFTRLGTNSRLSSQTNELVSLISFARSEAITKNSGLVLCRAATGVATACAGTSGDWEFWIIRNATGVVRRGTINTYGGTLVVDSTLTADSVTFGSDGLSRTGGNLVNAGDDDAHAFRVCSDRQAADNIRRLLMGASSRVTTTTESGAC